LCSTIKANYAKIKQMPSKSAIQFQCDPLLPRITSERPFTRPRAPRQHLVMKNGAYHKGPLSRSSSESRVAAE
jgi:hypothetical protein